VAPTQPPCSVAALAEPLAGSAPHRPTWVLIEHPGPWRRDAVLDAAWPVELGADFGRRLQQVLDAAGLRVVLARRPGRAGQVDMDGQPIEPGRRVVLARAGGCGWAAATTLDGALDLLKLPWTDLLNGHAPPYTAAADGWHDPGPVWGVCTHGTRDACCARLGRPIAAALQDIVESTGSGQPGAGQVWEISHSGGHRFAGVVLQLPEGVLYGRVDEADVPALVAARAAGAVVPHLMRGQVHRSPGVQAAEATLRERLGEPSLTALKLIDEATTTSTWRHEPTGATWTVRAVERPLAARPVSCGKSAEAGTCWVVTDVGQ
jgi:(2Fe-2S) ferredoxin